MLRSPEARRIAAMVALCVIGGLAVTFLVLPPRAAPPPSPPQLRVAGAPVPSSGDPVGSALDLVRRYAQGEIAIVLPDGTSRKVRRGALGAEIDRARLAEFVREAMRVGSPVQRAHQAERPGQPLDVPLPVSLDASVAISRLLDLKGELDAPAVDAFVDLVEKKLKPERVGHRLDVYGTLARIDAAFRSGQDSVEAAVERVTPKLGAASLGNVQFDQVLGYFETRYSQSAKYKERTYNLRQAASKLDGVVVMPGETFDFNEVVGPRDEAHGYRVAPVIAQGELVDGLGGGTCQISGTLHGAAFFAGLDIVERYPHSRPSWYIKLGLDATVVYPTINYRFRNPFDFPIVLHETVQGGVVRAEVLGPRRRHTVTYFRRIDEVVPFEQVERKTEKLPDGKRILLQRGVPGFKTTSSRVVRDGAYAVRTKWSDSYPPTTQILEVGTGPSDLETKREDDPHPEYVVDEVLVVTQGPEIRTPGATSPEAGGGTIEAREPGRTGERGWTEKAGYAVYKSDAEASKDEAVPAEGGTNPAAVKLDEASGKDDKPQKKKRKKQRKASAD